MTEIEQLILLRDKITDNITFEELSEIYRQYKKSLNDSRVAGFEDLSVKTIHWLDEIESDFKNYNSTKKELRELRNNLKGDIQDLINISTKK